MGKAARIEARADQMEYNDKRRRERAHGCGAFCEKANQHKRCTWKSCQTCSFCESEMEAKKKEQFVMFGHCLPYCGKLSSGTWGFKCGWKSCSGCHECRHRSPHGHDRRLAEEDKD